MPTQNKNAMHIFQQVMITGLTLNMYISTLTMCWFQQTMSTKHSTFITTPSIIYDQDFVLKKILFAKIGTFSIKMSETKLFFRLTQAISTYKHISRNIWATMTASRKLAHDKDFKKYFHKKVLKKKNCITIKKSYSSKSIHWYQWISVWKKVDDERFLHDKVFVLQNHLLQKQLYLL